MQNNVTLSHLEQHILNILERNKIDKTIQSNVCKEVLELMEFVLTKPYNQTYDVTTSDIIEVRDKIIKNLREQLESIQAQTDLVNCKENFNKLRKQYEDLLKEKNQQNPKGE